MVTPKVVVGLLAIAAIALVAGLLFRGAPEPPPIVLKIVSFEPAGIYDDKGEMWAVTLQMQRNDSQRGRSGPPIYVDDYGRAEARIADRWSPVDKFTAKCVLYDFQKHDMLFALPTTAVSCRLNLKWTRGRLVSGRLWKFAENLTAGPKARALLFKLHWAIFSGYPRYAPSSHWHEFAVELPLATVNPAGSK
jgi:hypothetical protein